MLKALLSDAHIWRALAVPLLVLVGFWFFPEYPGFPALMVVAISLPIALISWIVFEVAERRARAADQACYGRPPEDWPKRR